MAFTITIQDNTDTMVITVPGNPLVESIIEGLTEVTTLDMNTYTDFFAQKRVWENTFSYMSEADYNQLKGFYDRQFTQFMYPTISISGLGVNNVPARMRLSARKIVDNCGTVDNVVVNFRETIQMSVVS